LGGSSMKKYQQLFRTTFSQYLTYRLHVLSQIIQNLVTPVFMLLALTLSQPTGSLSSKFLIPYYALVSLAVPLTISNIDEELDDLVTTGDINNFLLKPFSLFRWLYIKNLSEKISIFLTVFPVFLVLILLNHPSVFVLSLSLIAIVLSFTLSFTFSYLVGLFCFWIDDFWAIHNTKFVLIQLLGGIVLPYSFFPRVYLSLLKYTPFPYLASWVPRFLQGSVPATQIYFIIFWILVMYLLARLLERRAISKYSFTAS
jgi:ABC-2 type transport system permease protein